MNENRSTLFHPHDRELYELYVNVLSRWNEIYWGDMRSAIRNPFRVVLEMFPDKKSCAGRSICLLDRGLDAMAIHQASAPLAVRADLQRLLAMSRVDWREDNS